MGYEIVSPNSLQNPQLLRQTTPFPNAAKQIPATEPETQPSKTQTINGKSPTIEKQPEQKGKSE